jgi:hypothetical protein
MKISFFLGFLLLFSACQNEAKQVKAEQVSALPTYTKTDTLQPLARDNSGEKQDSFLILSAAKLPDSVAFTKAGIWGMRYDGGELMFDVRDFILGIRTRGSEQRGVQTTNKGQYIHINLDNSLHLHSNDGNVTAKIPDGSYRMGCFLVRGYHESVKGAKAGNFTRVEIRNNTIYKSEALAEVALFYSVPMGDYSRKKSADILLDFYLANTNLAPNGNKVEVKINANEPILLDRWQAYLLKNLPLGQHKISLRLLDRQGKAIDKTIEKTFRILE